MAPRSQFNSAHIGIVAPATIHPAPALRLTLGTPTVHPIPHTSSPAPSGPLSAIDLKTWKCTLGGVDTCSPCLPSPCPWSDDSLSDLVLPRCSADETPASSSLHVTQSCSAPGDAVRAGTWNPVTNTSQLFRVRADSIGNPEISRAQLI